MYGIDNSTHQRIVEEGKVSPELEKSRFLRVLRDSAPIDGGRPGGQANGKHNKKHGQVQEFIDAIIHR